VEDQKAKLSHKWQERQKLTGSADGLKASSYNKVATTAPVKGPTQKIQWW